MGRKTRCNNLVTQRVEVALIYKEMLGLAEAMAYLKDEGVPNDVAERVLLTQLRRSSQSEPQARVASDAQFVSCRRRNRVHHAIVEAALKIETTLGTEWAHALLKSEKVPEDVARRVISDGPRQVRAKQN